MTYRVAQKCKPQTFVNCRQILTDFQKVFHRHIRAANGFVLCLLDRLDSWTSALVVTSSTGITLSSFVNYPGRFVAAPCIGDCLCLIAVHLVWRGGRAFIHTFVVLYVQCTYYVQSMYQSRSPICTELVTDMYRSSFVLKWSALCTTFCAGTWPNWSPPINILKPVKAYYMITS